MWFLPILLLCTTMTFAQDLDTDGSLFVGQVQARSIKDRPENVNARGSAYINETFLPIKVLNQKENNLFLGRYNAVNGDIEIMDVESKSKDIRALLKNTNEFIIEFMKDDKIYQTYNYIDESNNRKRDFLVNLVSSKRVSLLKKEEIKFFKAVIAKNSYEKDKPAEFKRISDVYYIKIGNTDATVLPSNKKGIAKLFPKHEDAIKSFIKKNKIRTSREEDLITLITYINTL